MTVEELIRALAAELTADIARKIQTQVEENIETAVRQYVDQAAEQLSEEAKTAVVAPVESVETTDVAAIQEVIEKVEDTGVEDLPEGEEIFFRSLATKQAVREALKAGKKFAEKHGDEVVIHLMSVLDMDAAKCKVFFKKNQGRFANITFKGGDGDDGYGLDLDDDDFYARCEFELESGDLDA